MQMQLQRVTVITEQAGITLTLWTCVLEVLDSNLGRNTDYTDLGFRRFLQSSKSNAGIVPRLGGNRFLPNPFPFIIHLSDI
jgi:hypothetical protein